MKEVKEIKIENEKIKVVFTNEANPDEPSLFVEFICVKNSEGKKETQVLVDPSIFNREPSFMGELFMNTFDSLLTIKEIFKKMKYMKRDNNEQYKSKKRIIYY
jgi:hypothetical protein